MTVMMKLPTSIAFGDGTPAEVSAARFAEPNGRTATEHGVRQSATAPEPSR